MAEPTPETVSLDRFRDWMRDYAQVIHENAGYLTQLDSAIGDADHGANMDRGMRAAVAAVDGGEFGSAAELFKKVGMTLVSTVGGASGPLYGTFFLRFGAAIDDQSEVDAARLGSAFKAGIEGIVARGKAEPGDKTMYDAWAPAVQAFEDAVGNGKGLQDALAAAVAAAQQGRDATTPMVARKGRASYLGERSAGHQDPGATSTTLMLESAAKTLGR
jgi:phosphoenolpyruvate---glycerone phosphotransferase subunit DhaL